MLLMYTVSSTRLRIDSMLCSGQKFTFNLFGGTRDNCINCFADHRGSPRIGQDNDVNASGHNPDHDSTDPPAPLPLFRSRQRAPRVGQRGYYHLVIPGPQLGTHTSFPSTSDT
ncbi:uncharacterized protein LOC117185900 [Drosophila miranda]|uniref:uncharacterized protein LOC117185900 n=1 Tax=Drosophila miranda TaxID=7229 RepID=UPI00143F18D0|nr:uncharacterized protein LOC117185900 [Drosophila miranda]